ncbi:MAG: hypothetical protein CBC12_07145 [Candidatus Puniceispirillum sp. TMED52]|nr:MAG: hypothetical protein CBC12_07145 [Candidatus Puniceispirillum sp. TMED52]RPF81985.1 MAG: SET domain-containing protein-lysine N-methyltransferase [Rhodothermaceae bacterium TMED105]|tara:strand:+ start:27912 stop:28790 length:879 start_codon:yes stop_codon:yes gene_type:complete
MSFEIKRRDDVCGVGMYATEPIPYDGLIVRESPLFIIKEYQKSKVSKEAISNALMKLNDEEKEQFRDLFGDNDMMRWRQNHFFIENKLKSYQEKPLGIYPKCARLNHSCSPNAERVYNDDQTVSLVAIRPIAIGEQITITYIDNAALFASYETRRDLLRKRGIFTTRFKCMCDTCCGNHVKSNINRSLIKELIPDNSIESSKEVWKLLKEENLSARLLSEPEALILVFPSETTVVIDGLEKQPGLNGKTALVRNHDLKRRRLGVTIDNVTVSVCHSKCTPLQKKGFSKNLNA